MSVNDLQPLRREDLVVGIPVAFSIYDGQRNLLLSVGQVVHSEKQVVALFEKGLFGNPLWQRPRKEQLIDKALPAKGGPTSAAVPAVARSGSPSLKEAENHNFSRLKLLPGTVLQIQSANDDTRPRSAHKLVGWQDKAGILISAINAQGIIAAFREGETLAVRLMAGKAIVTFETEVRKVCFSPFPYLHLAWPKILQSQQLRKNLRVNTPLIVSATPRGETQKYAGRVLNLSSGGAQLILPDACLNCGDELQLVLRLTAAGHEHVLALGSVVRNVNVDKDADIEQSVRYGLEFTGLAMAERLVLENFILQTQAEA